MLPPKLQTILEDLALFPDRADRVQALIALSENYKPAPQEIATPPYPENHRVPGCESEAFVWTTLDPQHKLELHFAVLNPQGVSAMALAYILKEALDGENPDAAQTVPDDIVTTVFGKELSMGKSLGLTNMVRAVQTQAAQLPRQSP